MTMVLGVDPGHSGAFAVIDASTGRIVSMDDMPTWFQTVGKKKRPRIDALALADMFDTYEMMGVSMMVIEAVGGRPAQSASAAFVFGYGLGLIYMSGLYSRIPIETVIPSIWKRQLNIQGKGNADDSAIIQRANELFPHDRDMFTKGPRSKKPSTDRAEAAMLAKYGADFLLRTAGSRTDVENRMTYTNADVAA